MTTVSAARLAKVFVEVADTLVDEFDIIEFLHLLADRAAGLVPASAVGLLLADQRGNLEFMAGSDENVKLLELFQIQNQEGPCLDAFRTRRPVINADLRTASARWPRFARRATAAGFCSVHAFPLRLRSEVIGALNLFGTGGDALDDADVQIVQAVADVATIGLLQERTIHRSEVLTEQLQGALNSRIVIEQAKGAIAQAHGVSIDEAFARMRSYARGTNRRLSDIAHAVVTDLTSVPELTTRQPTGGDEPGSRRVPHDR
jgi:transcriptional regulator with GAF, ATPase, and Fis domain